MLSPYIKRLRNKIGHEFLLLPSVSILVFNANHHLLLGLHQNDNVWVVPGGMVEPDESPMHAAVREMKEETGCEVRILKCLGSFGGPEFRVHYQNGDRVGYVMTVYQAEIITGTESADGEEFKELNYFPLEEIKNLQTGTWLPSILEDLILKTYR